ncbi:hypothetical protein FBU30_002370 [Linnemannia zychae]|nr:hypothetical protein FBU30_002370 [Linnemannia zychae]
MQQTPAATVSTTVDEPTHPPDILPAEILLRSVLRLMDTFTSNMTELKTKQQTIVDELLRSNKDITDMITKFHDDVTTSIADIKLSNEEVRRTFDSMPLDLPTCSEFAKGVTFADYVRASNAIRNNVMTDTTSRTDDLFEDDDHLQLAQAQVVAVHNSYFTSEIEKEQYDQHIMHKGKGRDMPAEDNDQDMPVEDKN